MFKKASVVSLMVACLVSVSASAQALPPPNLNSGNVLIELIIPTIIPVLLGPEKESVAPGDATLVLRTTTMTLHASFDAIAPYHPTALGVSSNLGRRPPAEYVNNYNKNVAILFATHKILKSLYPRQQPVWDSMLVAAGQNPNDNSNSLSSPIGIGNRAGNAVVAAREHDGMNQLGDEGGRFYNRMPYADTTGYQPVNTAYELKYPTRWQPDLVSSGNGIFKIQQHVTPQMAYVVPYSINPANHNVPAPLMIKNGNQGRQAYVAEVNKMLAATAALNDQTKMEAELFQDKIRSLGFGALFIAISRGMTLDQFVHYDFLTNMAAFDGAIVTWKEKIQHDVVRPFSAVPYVHGNNYVTAYAGKGLGTQQIRASEWRPYLGTADHSDYPSGSSCFCAAHAQASRRFLGSDVFGWSVPNAAGSSVVEPGITPAAPLTLTFPTFTDFENRCAQSRVNSGVHFEPATIAGKALCKPIGDIAFEFVQAHINGTAVPAPGCN